ncbi:MAG: MMPL family transporter, partial [Bacillus sp. (in: firmicutes)]
MQKFGGYIYQNRKWVLVIWVLVILLLGLLALKLPSVLSGNGFEYKGEYNKTRKLLEQEFGHPKSSIILVFEKDKTVRNEDFRKFILSTFEKLKDYDNAERIISPSEQNGMVKDQYSYGLLTFNKGADNLGKEITELKTLLVNKKGLKVTITGEPIIVQDLNIASQEDLAKAEMIGLPIALVVLILAFGGLIAASLPIVIGVVSILCTMGTLYFFSYGADLTIFILNIVPMIGLALSIDFALLFINRYKEELKTKSIKDALEITVSTAGRSIIFSGLCVFIGLSALWLIKIDIFQNVALGGMTVVLISAVCALTLLPALLGVLGTKINKFSILPAEDKQTPSFWYKFAKFVMKRPILMSTAALVILLAGLIPVKQMILAIPGTESLPPHYPSRTALEIYKDHFVAKEKREEKKVLVVVESRGNILDKNNLEKVKNVINDFEKDALVYTVSSPFSATGLKDENQLYQALTNGKKTKIAPIIDYFIRDNKMLLEVYLKTGEHSAKARQWVSDWSSKDLGLEAEFGGSIKFEQEIFSEIYQKAPDGLLMIVISTFVILMAAFRS